MTDAYNPQGYEEELVQQPEPAASVPTDGTRSGYHNRRARMPDGTIAVWQEAANGRGGRFVAMSAATASPQARETIDGVRSRATVLDRVAPLAEQYIRIGRDTPTGGWRQRSFVREQQGEVGDLWRGLNFPVQMYGHEERSRLERLRGLEDEALRANILPGQAGTANSAFEQEVLRGMFPNVQNLGTANQERAIALFVRRDLERAQVDAMERWLTRNVDLTGFGPSWDEQERSLRQQREQHYRNAWGLPGGANAGEVAGDAARRAAGAPRQGAGQAEEWVRNPQTGRLERRR